MDCIVHGVAKSRTGQSNFHFHFQTTSKLNPFDLQWILLENEKIKLHT